MTRNKLFRASLALLLLVVVSGCGTASNTNPPVSGSHLQSSGIGSGRSDKLPSVFQPVIRDADRAGISVLLPARLPDLPLPGWTWSLEGYKLDTKAYTFSLVATAKPLPPSAGYGPVPGAGFSLVMATLSGLPPPYPTETQLLAQPTGTVTVASGITANSYNHGMMVRWAKSGWTYTAVGPAPGTGISLAGQIVVALGSNPQAVPGSRGELTVSQLGNPMYSDAYWTYGNRWFAMTGLGDPGHRIPELRSLIRFTPSRS